MSIIKFAYDIMIVIIIIIICSSSSSIIINFFNYVRFTILTWSDGSLMSIFKYCFTNPFVSLFTPETNVFKLRNNIQRKVVYILG